MARCNTAHDALKADPARWAALRYVGQQIVEASDAEPAELLELRDCPCGSTLAKVVATVESPDPLPPSDARLRACIECSQPCPPDHTVCAVCAPPPVVTALAKCAAAICFASGGPRLDDRTAKLTYGPPATAKTYQELVERGWVEWRDGWRLSKRGTQIFIAIHEAKS